jgi:signal recognition particle subunit SEC65
MASTKQELQEEILSDMGFEPIEVTEKLYPEATGTERREISRRISNQRNNRKK